MESDYDHEMVLKSKDWVERLNPDSKLPNINTGRILVPERKLLQALSSLVPTEVKTNDQESKINELTKLVQMLMDENNSTQKTQEQKTVSSQPESSKSVNSSKQNLEIQGKALPTMHLTVASTTISLMIVEITLSIRYVEVMTILPQKIFVSFKSERYIREPILYLDSGCSSSMTGFKSYLHKYVEQPGPKVVFGDNSSCITEGYGSINCGGIVFSKVAFVNGLKYNLISISQLCCHSPKFTAAEDGFGDMSLQRKEDLATRD
ncbi:hypothetical protein Tco_0116223 [Tanacetum coccineum]